LKKLLTADFALLAFIILVGSILRLVQFPDIPFMFDELSAVNRLSFDSLSELLEKGVKKDGHPAGVQVFLFYWSKLFGISEAAIKLPFIFCGIASIPLIYLLGKKWFSGTTGLLAAACLATLQFPVLYSDIARPYMSGMFFSIVMALCWTNYLFAEKRKLLNLAGFAVCAALCAYNHYFSLFFAAIVGASGFLFLTKEKRNAYLLGCAFSILLFLPHLGLFLFQYETGGLDWLGKPKNNFPTEFLAYIFHYSPLVITAVTLFFLMGMIQGRQALLEKNKFRALCLFWFLLPFFVGFYYSVNVKPVLQFSVLIFSLPFLLLFLFSFYEKSSAAFKTCLILVLLGINTATLIFSRQHYQVFSKQPVEQFALQSIAVAKSEIDTDSTTIILNTDSNYLNYYFRKHHFKPAYYNSYHKKPTLSEFNTLLSSLNTNSVLLGGASLEQLNIAAQYFPYQLHRDFGYTYSLYHLSKQESPLLFSDAVLFKTTYGADDACCWSFEGDALQSGGVLQLDAGKEWGPTFSAQLENLFPNNNRMHIVDMSFSVKREFAQSEGMLVFEGSKDGELYEWRAHGVSAFSETDSAVWQKVYFPVRLADFIHSKKELENMRVKIYYWNKGKEKIFLKNFEIRVWEDNPWVYGLFGRLD